MTMSGALDETWRRIAEAFLLHVLGELSLETASARIAEAAQAARLEDDPRVSRVLDSLAVAQKTNAERSEHRHRVNNALHGVLSNLDFIAHTLAGESGETPLLAEAPVDDRQNVLQALQHARSAARNLSLALKQTDDDAR